MLDNLARRIERNDWSPFGLHMQIEVIRISQRLGMGQFDVAGRIYHLWCWAKDRLVDGYWEARFSALASVCGSTPEFAQALVDEGFVIDHGNAITVVGVGRARKRKKRKPKNGSVYFILDSDRNRVKIGFTSGDPSVRLSDLQTGSSSGLELIFSQSGTNRDERVLHERFSHLRIRGEWFDYADEISIYISVRLEAEVANAEA